jgi:hypothetical protein
MTYRGERKREREGSLESSRRAWTPKIYTHHHAVIPQVGSERSKGVRLGKHGKRYSSSFKKKREKFFCTNYRELASAVT